MIIIKDTLIAPYVLKTGVRQTEVCEPADNGTLKGLKTCSSFGEAVMHAAELSYFDSKTGKEMSVEEFSTTYTEHMNSVLSQMDKLKKAVEQQRG